MYYEPMAGAGDTTPWSAVRPRPAEIADLKGSAQWPTAGPETPEEKLTWICH